MEFFRENWDWISSNPWLTMTLIILSFASGWGVARLFYGERISVLKEKLAGATSKISVTRNSSNEFRYPHAGRYGRNILANSIHDANVGDEMSFSAEVPDGGKLHVVLNLSSGKSVNTIWGFSVDGKENWTHSRFHFCDKTQSYIQHFNAETGKADMKFSLMNPGVISVKAFEGESQNITWEKNIHVYDKPRLA